ncbi:hypothetical protein H6G33_35265 [Calothrix sp. FACHB-1219]|uniref:hypothetical protein n=1 Tax=unclassified Calothrix TaxID=2619626 RepID=UPI0016855993|nr:MULTISPECIES: hypothetical protein [unclassified Calothrix]MBD2207593.1 hypothetical protein [Calothrix sp. FACHB-168]MBD2222194.1 hypothetical protein [Calothrix sp. FACHB-1219]
MRKSQNFASFKPNKNVGQTLNIFYTSLPRLSLGLRTIIWFLSDFGDDESLRTLRQKAGGRWQKVLKRFLIRAWD